MLLHIPHSSIVMIDDVKVVNLQENLNLLTDWFTDELFFHSSADYLVFKYSRLSVDVERYLHDEPMEKYDQGVLYKKDAFGVDIERGDDTKYLKLYNDHHYLLNQKVGWCLAYFPIAFIVDCHSFPDKENRPDICLGIGSYTPESVISQLKYFFNQRGFSVNINDPYTGSIIPKGFENDDDVYSIMIEINRKLYLDDKYNKNEHFDRIRDIMTEALDIIYEYTEKEGAKRVSDFVNNSGEVEPDNTQVVIFMKR